ncbi:MAG TPA: hypothetical protein QGF02_00425 [Candidatus Babeliales bacterium]|nr:hypothetical protein [Candidatus Babeliales bacterium]
MFKHIMLIALTCLSSQLYGAPPAILEPKKIFDIALSNAWLARQDYEDLRDKSSGTINMETALAKLRFMQRRTTCYNVAQTPRQLSIVPNLR